MNTKRFWLDALERAVKTFAQSLVAFLTTGAVSDVVSIPWPTALGGAGLAALVSLLTSVASSTQKDAISPASVVPPV